MGWNSDRVSGGQRRGGHEAGFSCLLSSRRTHSVLSPALVSALIGRSLLRQSVCDSRSCSHSHLTLPVTHTLEKKTREESFHDPGSRTTQDVMFCHTTLIPSSPASPSHQPLPMSHPVSRLVSHLLAIVILVSFLGESHQISPNFLSLTSCKILCLTTHEMISSAFIIISLTRLIFR